MLFLGTDFPYDDFLPVKNNVQVDIDPARLGRRVPLAQGIAADLGLTIRALLPNLEQRVTARSSTTCSAPMNEPSATASTPTAPT